MISIQVFCHVVHLKHSFVTSWENVLFTLKNIGTCVKITWNYFLCVVLHKVKVFFPEADATRESRIDLLMSFDVYLGPKPASILLLNDFKRVFCGKYACFDDVQMQLHLQTQHRRVKIFTTMKFWKDNSIDNIQNLLRFSAETFISDFPSRFVYFW